MKCGTNRAAAYASSMGSPEEFIAFAEEMAAAHGRKYETYNLVLAGAPRSSTRTGRRTSRTCSF